MIATWLGASVSPLATRDIHTLVTQPPDWTERAACRQLPPVVADELFFPEHGKVTPAARALCAGCPVARECASASVGEVGIWAGVNVGQRGVA